MKLLVCGGRDFTDQERLFRELDKLHKASGIKVVINGGAGGADALSSAWARTNGVERMVFKADWGLHGKAAGPIRNQEMLDVASPDYVVAFPGGRGTADMIRRAINAGIPVYRA